ncbi:MAG TPA: YajG family lipoprotein, partial [Reyranellaceae bacterium]|nr:YajG family lipoprotein [Reyranellaceae bacterium]
QYADRISTKKNTYGMEMARIVASNDVPTVVRQALEQELRLLGFRIEAGGMPVGVELQNFYNNFKVGFFSGDAVAEVAFAVKVRDAGGALVYSQFYSATETEANIMLASGENAKKALEKALASAVKRAIEDRALQQALLATRPAQPQQRRVGS